jgi:hypothetical protein
MKGTGVKVAVWILLLAALSISLYTETHTKAFLPVHHGYLTSMGLAMGKNLDREHHFLLFTRKWIDAQGKAGVDPHNRFPILSYALIAATVSKCSDDPVCEMDRGRILMLLFCWGALVLATLMLWELSGNPLLAVCAALIGFSSYFLQYYNDMVFNDVPALFGFILVLYGITLFETRGNLWVLWLGTMLAIALGWQAYGALLTWWVLVAIRSVTTVGLKGGPGDLIRHRATRTMVMAVAWGCLLLVFNIFNEKSALNVPVSELPSLKSIEFRLGVSGGSAEYPEYKELRWKNFLNKQARRVMKATIPTRPLHAAINDASEKGSKVVKIVVGVCGLAVAILAVYGFGRLLLGMKKERVAFLALLLSGLVWCLSMRHFTAFHDFQAMFYVGFAMAFWLALCSRLPEKALGWMAVLALAVFTYSAVDLNRFKTEEGRSFESRTTDFAAIRKIVGENRRIQVGQTDAEFEAEFVPFRFYMAGNYYSDPTQSQFIVTRDRAFASPNLTPGNHEYFLFRAPGSR